MPVIITPHAPSPPVAHGSPLVVDCETCGRGPKLACCTTTKHTPTSPHATRKKAAAHYWEGWDAALTTA